MWLYSAFTFWHCILEEVKAPAMQCWGGFNDCINWRLYIFTKSAPWTIKSICYNVCLCVVGVLSPSVGNWNRESRRLIVKGRIGIIEKLRFDVSQLQTKNNYIKITSTWQSKNIKPNTILFHKNALKAYLPIWGGI